MFNLIEEADGVMHVLAWPGSDISGINSSPPLVDLGQHPQLGGRIYLSKLHVIEALHALAPVIGVAERELIAKNLGVCTPAEHEELLSANVRLAGELEDLKEAVEKPLGELIDFFEERTKRRPEVVEQAPVA